MSRFFRDLFKASSIYLFFAGLIYWPVIVGWRFFWEDFANQEYPIREFAFTSIGLLYKIPLWNPYSWAWAAFSADPQSALWYPTNLLQIFLTRIFFPAAQHLPVVMPEIMTILHLPFAALGMYLLTRKRYQLDHLPALLAGFLWGFGTRMIAEQNHQMTVYQWLWLPWCAYFLLRSLDEYRFLFPFALTLGISFLAGQPQLSLFNSTFLGCWVLYELWLRTRSGVKGAMLLKVASVALGGFLLAASISAVQYVGSIELSKATARASLSYSEAGGGSLTIGQLVNFFSPRILGEYSHPEPTGKKTIIGADSDHWETQFSWSVMGEVLAALALWKLWKRRRERNTPQTRDLTFFVWFSIFAILFGLGYHLGFNWIFWKFVPIYDRVRNPSRMVMYLSFAGAIYGGIGLQLLLEEHAEALKHAGRFLVKALSPFLFFSHVGVFGIIDLVVKHDRHGVWYLTVPTLLVSLLSLLFVIKLIRQPQSKRSILTWIFALVLIDLFVAGFTWHRNTTNPQEQFEAAMNSEPGKLAKVMWRENGTKLLAARGDSGDMVRNAGMYFRAPIEPGSDSVSLKERNPMRLSRPFVPAQDSLLAFRIMGVGAIFDSTLGGRVTPIQGALPFLKLYSRWIVAPNEAATALLLRSDFDYQSTAIVEGTGIGASTSQSSDSTIIERQWVSEDSITCTTNAAKPTMLFVNDLFYGRWRATVDGKPVAIYRAFSALRAVSIPEGRHEVLLYYDDGAVRLGGMISVGAITISLIGMLLGWLSSRKEPTRNLSDYTTGGLGAGGGSSRA